MSVKLMGKTIAVVALIVALTSPAYARWLTWGEALYICSSIIAESASAGAATAAVIVIQAVGLQTSGSIVVQNSSDPESQPSFLMPPSPGQPASDVVAAMQALNPPNVTPSGTPAEILFIQKVNIFVDQSRNLKNPRVFDTRAVLNQMSVALEDAADAYDATGLSYTFTQADINAFKAHCADGTCSTPEENVLIDSGLTPAQRQTLSLHLSTAEVNLSVASVSLSTIMHEGARLLHQNSISTVPALPGWGLGIFAALLVTIGSIVLRRHRIAIG